MTSKGNAPFKSKHQRPRAHPMYLICCRNQGNENLTWAVDLGMGNLNKLPRLHDTPCVFISMEKKNATTKIKTMLLQVTKLEKVIQKLCAEITASNK